MGSWEVSSRQRYPEADVYGDDTSAPDHNKTSRTDRDNKMTINCQQRTMAQALGLIVTSVLLKPVPINGSNEEKRVCRAMMVVRRVE